MEKEIKKLKEVLNTFSRIHSEFNEITKQLESIENRRSDLRSSLLLARDAEHQIISDLEKKLGRSVTPEVLLELLNKYE